MTAQLKTEDLEQRLESMLDIERFPPPEEFRKQALVTDDRSTARPPRTSRASGLARRTS